jgi:signal transduction histidine kinase
MRKISIVTRIILIYGSALGILFLFSILAFYFAIQLREGGERIIKENISSMEAAIHLKREIFHQKEFIYRMMTKGWDPVSMENLFEEKENFQSWLSKAKSSVDTEEEKEILDKLSLLYDRVSVFHKQIVEKKTVPENEARQAIEDYGAMRGLCLELVDMNKDFIDDIANKRKMDFKKMNIIILTFLISGVSISMIFVFFLTRGIVKPLRKLMNEAKSAGLYGEDSTEVKGDEISMLGTHMHHLISLLENSDKKISEQRERLIHAEKFAALGEIATKIADEVRNPIAGIRTGIQLIKRETESNESFQKRLEQMVQELNRVEKVLFEILNYSCPKAPHFGKIDLMKLLKESISDINKDIAEKEISVELRNYGPLIIEADLDMLKEVFSNILRNAVENLSKGDRIMARIEEGTSDTFPYIHLVFEDTGPGLPSEQLEDIFKPFTTTKPMGVGLGLAVCHNIILEHKGRIWAENGSKGGLKFHIVLPKKQEAV